MGICTKIATLITIILSMGLCLADESDHTQVNATIEDWMHIEVPQSFSLGNFNPGENKTHLGGLEIEATLDWRLLVEDNSEFFVPDVGPGNGYMTKQPYDSSHPVQLKKPHKVTIDGNEISLNLAPGHSPKLITDGIANIYLKDVLFKQEVVWGDYSGVYKIVVTFIIQPEI